MLTHGSKHDFSTKKADFQSRNRSLRNSYDFYNCINSWQIMLDFKLNNPQIDKRSKSFSKINSGNILILQLITPHPLYFVQRLAALCVYFNTAPASCILLITQNISTLPSSSLPRLRMHMMGTWYEKD